MPTPAEKDAMGLSDNSVDKNNPVPDATSSVTEGQSAPVPKQPKSELYKRVLSSVFLIPVCLGCFYYGGMPFSILMGIVGALALFELLDMVKAKAIYRFFFPVVLASLAFVSPNWLSFLLPAYVFLGAFLASLLNPFSVALYGFMIPVSLWTMLQIRSSSLDHPHHGFYTLLILLFVVWATDIGAYFVGRKVGGIKLCPKVSPKKTVSGAVGGMVCAVSIGGILLFFQNYTLTLQHIQILAATSIISQVGDLWESYLKRRYDIKDSSHIIPGHGGVLDRVDGLLPAAIFWYFMMMLQWV